MKIPPLTAPQPHSNSFQHNADETYLTKRKLKKKNQYQSELPAKLRIRPTKSCLNSENSLSIIYSTKYLVIQLSIKFYF